MSNITSTKKKSPFSSFLNLMLLPFLIYLLIILAFCGVLKLHMPLHTLIMCGVLLVFAIFFAPQNEYFVYKKISNNSDIFENDLANFLSLNSLKIDELNKANIDFDEFFDDYLHKVKPLSFGYIASAVFPMLGILGTFISIAISMPNFMNDKALESEISLLLNGVATAFYVSIYGIFLTIWWMFYSRLGMAKIDELKEQYKFSCKKHFWSKEELQRLSLKKNYDLLNANSELINKINDNEFFDKLSKLHKEKFDTFANLFVSYEKIAVLNSELAKKSLEFCTQNNEEMQKKLDEFKELLSTTMMKFENIKNDLDKNFTDFKEIYEEEKFDFNVIDNLKQDIKKLSDETDEVLNKINNA